MGYQKEICLQCVANHNIMTYQLIADIIIIIVGIISKMNIGRLLAN